MAIEIQNLLLFLVFVSGGVTEFVEQIKKQIMLTIFKGAEILTPEQQSLYEAILLVTRFVAGFVGILILGGYSTLVGLLPFFGKLPELGVLVACAFIIGLGSDTIFIVLSFIKSIGSWNTQPPVTDAKPASLKG